MTRYTVVWLEETQNDWAELWIASRDQAAISEAANEIDQTLRFDPDTKGIEAVEDIRGLAVPPLKVLFAVDEQDRKAVVFRVRLM